MNIIHDKYVRYGEDDGKQNYRIGTEIASFPRVADALVSCGNS